MSVLDAREGSCLSHAFTCAVPPARNILPVFFSPHSMTIASLTVSMESSWLPTTSHHVSLATLPLDTCSTLSPLLTWLSSLGKLRRAGSNQGAA